MQDLIFLTDIKKHLQTLNFALQGIQKIISDFLKQFHVKIRIFQKEINLKTFCHFFDLRTTVNAIPEVRTEHKVEEYKDKWQGLAEELQSRFGNFQELKPCFTFLINPLDSDVIYDNFPVC